MSISELNLKLSKIKMLILDIDGTMTDGKMYYSQDGEAMKAFAVRDGMGLTLLKKSGILTGFITSESSPIVLSRAKKLQIDKVKLGSRNKPKHLLEMIEDLGLNTDEVAYMGDDVNDYHILQRVGFASCPKDAVKYIKSVCHYVSKYNGGDGAVREICEMILTAQNKPILLSEEW